ncbi:MAG TPA: hypothetical protein PKM43_11565 [Verrucomicrobiota bacterium]|nr:hypothetical protein [Verrucomicrobiota bacterium]HRZ37749.1 hypothetical protein [Candidatus Paceibacterota bacterium]HRZ55503.1 hypothetical protein [Candidatus Paceibacterota bacterium]
MPWPITAPLQRQTAIWTLTQQTSADLKQIVKLLQQKETPRNRLARIDAELAAYSGGKTAKAVKGETGRKPR